MCNVQFLFSATIVGE